LSPTARRALLVCAVLAALSAAALVAQAWALASLVASLMSAPAHGSSASPLGSSSLGSSVVGSPLGWLDGLLGTSGSPLGGWLAVLAGAVVARALLSWATHVVAARAAAGTKQELRAALLDRSLALGPEWIAARGVSDLTVLATKGLDALDAYFTVYLPAVVTSLVVPLGIGAAILWTDWPSAVLVVLTVPLIPVFAALVGLHTRDRVSAAADATARLSRHLYELVRALPVLTAFRRAAAQATAVRRVSEAHRRATLGTLKVAFLSAFVLELVATLSVALIAVGIGLRLVTGDLTLAVGLMVLILAPECYLPLRAAGAAHHASEDGVETVRRVAALLDSTAPQHPAPAATAPPADPAALVSGTVEIRELRVSRRDGYAPDGLSFTVRPGEIVRLESPSGSGKSTAFSVLLGFARPDSGRVRVGGVDLGAVDPEAWRRSVAWVPQRPAFTGGTVTDELLLAVPDASRDELAAVTGRVAADHLLDRPITELSTGERQRVAVARALLRVDRGATLLLLDEPTAHLDDATAAQVMSAVRHVAETGVAVVLAAHRGVAGSVPSPPAAAPALAQAPATGGVRPTVRDLVTRRTFGGALLGAAALLAGVALTATSAWLIAKASLHPPILTLSVAIVGVRFFGLGKAALRYVERLVTHDAAFRTAIELRVRLWNALVRLGPARTLSLHRGEGLRRLVDDVDAVRDLTPRVLVPPIVVGLVCLGAVAVQTALAPAAGLALAAAVLVAGVGGAALTVLLERRATSRLADGRRRIAQRVLTLLDAAPDLLAFGAARGLQTELARADAELTSRARRQALGNGAATALIVACTGAAAAVGVWLTAGRIDPVLITVLALVPLVLTEVLVTVPPAVAGYDSLRTTYGRVAATLAEADQTPQPATAPASPAVRLSGVDVGWPGSAEPALRDVYLDIPVGAHVAVVGPSGAGKSTLLALLLGFLPARHGVARIPERVAWCPQEPQLVSTTIRENLRLADPKADDERLTWALDLAGLAGWRLDTRLDGNGATTSGGEAQRLALARALVAADDAELVLLDEPTAHLDLGTAQAVLDRLRAALRGRTVLHVTHRAEEAAQADLVVHVDNGRVRVTQPATV
jgi:ATP-binding cassette subfamily C protein CydCD